MAQNTTGLIKPWTAKTENANANAASAKDAPHFVQVNSRLMAGEIRFKEQPQHLSDRRNFVPWCTPFCVVWWCTATNGYSRPA